jgi:hypothetical protein
MESRVIKIEKAREMAIQIIDKFEELLDRKGIKIPCFGDNLRGAEYD